MKKLIITAFLLLWFNTEIWAGGYQLNLFGIRQIGMVHIGAPFAHDASNIAFNPGSTAFIPRSGVVGGSSFTFINTGYLAPAPSTYRADTKSDVNFPFNFHAVYRPQEGRTSNWGAGVSVYTPYGSSVAWPEGWKNQFFLQEISLQSVYIQPSIGYQYEDIIGIGGGLIYGVGLVNLQRNLPIADQDGNYGRAELDGSAEAWGYSLGLMIRPTADISIGAGFRSQLDMEVEGGDAIFTVPESLQGSFPPENTFSASLPLPWVLSFGVAASVNPQLTLAAQADLTGWSAYEELFIDFGENTEQLQDSPGPRNYEDAWIFRLGGEYHLDGQTDLRAGVYYDMTPVQDGYMTPETPDSDRIAFSAGLTRKITDDLGVNLSLLYIRSQQREQTQADLEEAGTVGLMPTGKFQSIAFIPGISVNYSF